MRVLNRLLNFFCKIFLTKERYSKRSGVKIGDGSIVANSVDFGSEPYLVTIGRDFYSSDNVKFITHDGSVNVLRKMYKNLKNVDYIKPIILGDNVFLGINVVVLPGSKIGSNVIVGASSVVKGELASNSVYAGVPARFICSIEEYLNKIEGNLIETKALESSKKKEYLMNIYGLKL